MNFQNQIGLFAKYWRPATVKTRLAAVIGDELASQIYLDFLTHLTSQLGESPYRTTIVFSPQQSEPSFKRLAGDRWDLLPQSDGGLGIRMQRFFESRFQDAVGGAGDPDTSAGSKIIVIGSDCPTIDCNLIQSAFSSLDEKPVVIGPSTDGGYYLIGMRDQCFDIFNGIKWSTDAVLRQTIAQLNAQQVEYNLLPEMTDVDQWDDLKTLLESLRLGAIGASEETNSESEVDSESANSECANSDRANSDSANLILLRKLKSTLGQLDVDQLNCLLAKDANGSGQLPK